MAQKKKETTAKEKFRKAASGSKASKAKKSKAPKTKKVPESFYDDLSHMQSIFGRMGRGGIAGPGGCCIPRRRRF